MSTVAIIPVRKGSIRIPNKNLRSLNGCSLLERKIRQLQNSGVIDRVVVGTNCEQAKAIALARGADVLDRADYYCDESRASANDMIADLANRVAEDLVVWAHCTNPFVYGAIIRSAVDQYRAAVGAGFDSLLSVYKVRNHAWDHTGRPLNYDPYGPRHPLAATLAPMLFQDGALFIQPTQQMQANSYFFGKSPTLYEIEFPYCLDINVEADFQLAEHIVGWLDEINGFAIDG